MKKISLQWRLTILTTVLITVLCGCLTFFLYKNGIYYFDTLQETVEKAICRSYERISGARNASISFELDTHRLILEFETPEGETQRFAMDEMRHRGSADQYG